MNRPRSVMVDIETKGIDKRSVILSIGAVAFDDDGFLNDYEKTRPVVFYGQVPWDDPTQADRVMDDSTMQWWSGQQEARRVLESPALHQQGWVYQEGLPALLAAFAKFVKDERSSHGKLCAKGIDFDLAILEQAYKDLGQDTPWPFWHSRCLRGFFDACQMAGISPYLERGVKDTGLKHHAGDDAIFQTKVYIRYAHELWKIKHKGAQQALGLDVAPEGLRAAP